MKDSKGFTLIELLAIIVVLAIILAIAVPTIGNVIKNSTRNAFEIDAKMVLKAVDYKRLKNVKFDPLVVTKDNMMEQIGFDSSQYAQVTFKAKETETEMILVGAGKWDGLIAYGTIDNMRIVNSGDYDETPPAITILGDNPIEVGKGSTYTDAGATAFDLKDGAVPITSTVIKNTSNTIVESIDTSTFTSYTITYTAVDKQGNIGSAARQVIVADKTAPVITILGSNPASINVGGTYSDAGATALDDTDGNITSKIAVTGTVNPSVVGSYTITYTVKDLANNQATAVTRTVKVLDNVIPTVAFGTNGNATYAKSRSTTVTVSDNVGVNSSSLKYQWTTSTTAPTEASFSATFTNGGTISTPAGVTGGYYLWILAKDTSGNTMIARSNVFNLDNTKPVITRTGSSLVTVNKGSTYSDAGATATDAHSGIAGSVTVTGTVNPSVIGTYTITYNVSDNAGNAATPVTRIVNVVDVLAPVITISGSNPASINLGGAYSDAGATALDDVDGNVTSRIVVTGTVNPSVIGTYTITYTVKDNANNQAVATRTVYVVDNVPPTVAFNMNGNATYAKSRSTTVTVSDNVSVNTSSLKYQWTTSTTAPTEASFSTAFTNGGTISTPAGVTGGYYLWILAKDTSGNTMINRSNVFNLDNTVPTISSVNLNGYTVGTWTNGNLTVTINATDTHSGIQKYQYSVDGGTTWYDTVSNWSIWDGYSGNTIIRVIDNAGNISANTNSYHLLRDTTAPSIPTVNLNGYTSGTWTKNNITFSLSSTDGTSGINRYQYSWNGGSTWTDTAGGWTYTWDANDSLLFRAIDNAGNTSGNTATYIFRRDTTAPIITLIGSNPTSIAIGSIYSDTGATATDATSGIAGSVTSTSNVNPSVGGTYTVTYNASDNAGNVATPITRTVQVYNSITDFAYTGSVQSVVVPASITKAIIEVWGAQGGGDQGLNGCGGYTKGTFDVTSGQTLYVYVGGKPSSTDGGWNGGGNAGGWPGYGGGGATDVRQNGTALTDRIIVAAGGGGESEYNGGSGGGLSGFCGYDGVNGDGGTQTAGGAGGGDGYWYGGGSAGGFGYGGKGGCYDGTGEGCGGGGGSGWYGGGGGQGASSSGARGGGGGGSSYIKAGATNTEIKNGQQTFHQGNGAARITFITSVNDYNYTGLVQQYKTTTSRVIIEVWGASGGSTNQGGGGGGYAKGTFTLPIGQTLYIYVGGTSPSGTTGGWNGGGNGAGECGGSWLARGGGGGTDIRLNGTALTDRIIVAGGGGGAAEYSGGAGGGLYGTNVYDGVGGYGGTPTSGGAGADSEYPQYGGGGNGSFGQGGGGGKGYQTYAGGGGGGGWYGGGGGSGGESSNAIGGGGGGSGYIRSDAANTEMQTGVRGGNGYVRITVLN